jgi:transposase
MVNMTRESYVGIDVGKKSLDLAIYGSQNSTKFSNTEEGIEKIITTLQKIKPSLIVVEATGGYERPLVVALLSQGLPISVVNPTRVRALAKASGKLAKTDALDAHLIAEYAFLVKPQPISSFDEAFLHLQALVKRREQVIEMQTAEKNRLEKSPLFVREYIEKHLLQLKEEITLLEKEIKTLVASIPHCQEGIELLSTIPGVGFITSVTVLALLPELGKVDNKAVASLAGLAPFNRDSGKKQGKRKIFGGRKRIRRVLYLSALSAIKHNPVIKEFHERLMEKGKIPKVAITACMRKILTIMNAMARDNTPWQEFSLAEVKNLLPTS